MHELFPALVFTILDGQVREWEGVEALDGIDTLAVHLLAEGTPATASSLSHFAAQPNHVSLLAVERILANRGLVHAMALLCSQHGEPRRALQLWQVCQQHCCLECACPAACGPQSMQSLLFYQPTLLTSLTPSASNRHILRIWDSLAYEVSGVEATWCSSTGHHRGALREVRSGGQWHRKG